MKIKLKILVMLQGVCKDNNIEVKILPRTTIQNCLPKIGPVPCSSENKIDYYDFIDIIRGVNERLKIKLPEPELSKIENIADLGKLIDRFLK